MSAKLIAAAMAKAKEGVIFSPKDGAVCPWCGAVRIPVTSSPKWDAGIKIRYHKCKEHGCLLAQMGQGVKSIQGE
ncbi:hypothetical protein [Maridesulfovibrio frigidus]|uniref:hypothetical protein n=1 Tax=Maridesulfovibrio frigidus TaxID=340956 RepID=UPI0004E0C47A|nr:hypothetical protein [Maridesulfovibrio frigidus]